MTAFASMHDALTLGALIDLLSKHPADKLVGFDFGGCSPTRLSSYRGFYEDVALGFSDESRISVRELRDHLVGRCGGSHEGWKGGTYPTRRECTIWVANPGNTSDTLIVGVEECDWMVVLKTKWVRV